MLDSEAILSDPTFDRNLFSFVGPPRGWQAGQVPTGMWTEERDGAHYLNGPRHWNARHGSMVILQDTPAFDEHHARNLVRFFAGPDIAETATIEEHHVEHQ